MEHGPGISTREHFHGFHDGQTNEIHDIQTVTKGEGTFWPTPLFASRAGQKVKAMQLESNPEELVCLRVASVDDGNHYGEKSTTCKSAATSTG